MVAAGKDGAARKAAELERLVLVRWGDVESRDEERRCCWLFLRALLDGDAVDSWEGISPKTKNLMKAPMRMTIDSWPSRKPWVNDRLSFCCERVLCSSHREPYEDCV